MKIFFIQTKKPVVSPAAFVPIQEIHTLREFVDQQEKYGD